MLSDGGSFGAIAGKNAEWAFFEPFFNSTRARSGRPANNYCQVLGGIFWIVPKGAQMLDLAKEFGRWSSFHRQFRLWTVVCLRDLILDATNEGEVMLDQFQMTDDMTVDAHDHAACAEGDSKDEFWTLKGFLHDQNPPDRQRYQRRSA